MGGAGVTSTSPKFDLYLYCFFFFWGLLLMFFFCFFFFFSFTDENRTKIVFGYIIAIKNDKGSVGPLKQEH